MTATTTIDIRPAASRMHTRLDWLDSHHSFSFGEHHDPTNVGHGLLIVSNDDVVAPGRGFGTHPHRDMEIVTWVLSGELEHRDSAGHEGVIYPGLAQRMSAGRGILHSEMNHSRTEPVHFVQMWVVPDTAGIEAGYEQLDVSDRLAGGDLVPVASGQAEQGAIGIHQKGATMWVARIAADGEVTLPDTPYVHAFVARGDVELDGRQLSAGDAARLTSAGPRPVKARGESEIIVWGSDRQARR
jgi:hypothetical protein